MSLNNPIDNLILSGENDDEEPISIYDQVKLELSNELEKLVAFNSLIDLYKANIDGLKDKQKLSTDEKVSLRASENMIVKLENTELLPININIRSLNAQIKNFEKKQNELEITALRRKRRIGKLKNLLKTYDVKDDAIKRVIENSTESRMRLLERVIDDGVLSDEQLVVLAKNI